MKIICTTETELNKKVSCKKEYCCNKLKIAMETHKKKDNNYGTSSNFEIQDSGKIKLETHSSYDEESHYMNVSYCLFCGKKLVVEKVKVDKTKDLPFKTKIKEVEKIVYVKKKHWWNL